MPSGTKFAHQALAVGIALEADVPLILWGNPGQGKTKGLEALAAGRGWHLETVIASIREPADFAGLPVVGPDGSVHLAPPSWARRLAAAAAAGKTGLLFFDELSTAVPATQAALLRVINDRVVGDLPLPPGTRIAAAANDAAQAADGWDLAAPTANRFLHLSYALPADVVADGFMLTWPEVPQLSPVDLPAHRGRAAIAIASFLRARPLLVTVIPDSAAAAGKAYPTPRSWEMAMKLLATSWSVSAPKGVVATLLAGAVGDAAASELISYLNALDLPDPEQVLADPEGFVLPERADVAYAVGGSVLLAVENHPTAERWAAYGKLLARLASTGRADISVVLGERWAQIRPAGAVPPPALTGALVRTLRLAGKLPEDLPGPAAAAS